MSSESTVEDLVDAAPVPALAATRANPPSTAVGAGEAGRVGAIRIADVEAVPIGCGGFGVDGRAAMSLGLGEQSLIVFFGGLVGIRADDPIARKSMLQSPQEAEVGGLGPMRPLSHMASTIWRGVLQR